MLNTLAIICIDKNKTAWYNKIFNLVQHKQQTDLTKPNL